MFPWGVMLCKRLQKHYRSYEMAKDLDRNEWYFEECPADEIDYCWTYEYARESELLRRVIAKWRRGAKGNMVEDYRALSEEIHAEPYGCVYPFFPCWPNKPYLSIDPKIRKTWLGLLGMPPELEDLIDEPPYEIQARYWSKESTAKMLKRFVMSRSLSFRNESLQFVVFNVDWNLHNKELETRFGRWLKENRPAGIKAREMRGRGTSEREGRANLKYLSVYRLGKQMPRDDAMAFLAEEGGKLKPYKTYQSWDSAVDKASAIIRSLEAGTFIVPPFPER